MPLGVFIGDASGLRTDVSTLLANARDAEALGFATGWCEDREASARHTLEVLAGLAAELT